VVAVHTHGGFGVDQQERLSVSLGWLVGGWLVGGWLVGGWLVGGWLVGGWLVGGWFRAGITGMGTPVATINAVDDCWYLQDAWLGGSASAGSTSAPSIMALSTVP
jgi:hypothetical protein